MSQEKHWNVSIDQDHIIWLGLDRQAESVNTINDEVLDELNAILQDASQNDKAKGLIIYSMKSTGFIAGADVNGFTQLDQPGKAIEFLMKGQAVLSRLEALSIPTLALIDGFCMGGGLELALACDYRIASDSNSTRLGLPEVLLGIHPGWGGTIRLPKLIGGFEALSKVILTGAALPAKKAKKLGFVDDVVPHRQLKRAALYFIQKRPHKYKATTLQAMSNHSLVRPVLAYMLRRVLRKKVNQQHYPAPYAIVDFWEKEARFDERAYRKEAESVEALAMNSGTAHNLIRAFLLRDRMKGFAKHTSFEARHVHVIGAGVMGGDIAAWCALRGLHVTLQDKTFEQIGPAIGRAHTLFKRKLKKPRPIQAAMDRLVPDPDGCGVSSADVIIEAVFENLAVKQAIMKSVEARAKPEAVIATNTSSIPLDNISDAMKDPERLVGIHFFNPVAKMELVEVVIGQKTSKEVADNAAAFVGQISRLPLPVKSSPGFLVNRVLMPYLLECVQLLDDGYQAETIDAAATDFGMMMGPVELADTVGLDICLAVAENLTQHFGGSVPNKLREMVKSGDIGRKVNRGFYKYKKGKPIKNTVSKHMPTNEIANRLILRMLNEAAACLREGVVADTDLLDAGMIFGTGFAPFRGGPMHYAQQFGHDKLNAVFIQLESQYGERFKPHEHLVALGAHA